MLEGNEMEAQDATYSSLSNIFNQLNDDSRSSPIQIINLAKALGISNLKQQDDAHETLTKQLNY